MPEINPMLPTTAMIPIAQLVPNSWNPNTMSDAAFLEYVAEVRHLGTLPKPVVCRRVGDKFEIIDGEHGFRAAREVGLAHVPCVETQADDFEAMRQTYKRNRGGDDDPLLLGQMFQRMLCERNLSVRGLAREIDIPESTLRIHLNYPKALELRSACAGEDRSEEIRGLSHEEVGTYLRLPDGLRDAWADAGFSLKTLRSVRRELHEIIGPVSAAGLIDAVEPDILRFGSSLRLAVELGEWQWDHRHIEQVGDYVRPLALLRIGRLKLMPPSDAMSLLPCEARGEVVVALIAPDKWAAILRDAAKHLDDPKGLHPLVASGVRRALREAGVDLAAVLGPEVAEAVQIVHGGPDFIREADFLALKEQVQLIMAQADAPEEIVLQAKRMTVEQFRTTRTNVGSNDSGLPGTKALSGRSVIAAFENCVGRILREQHVVAEDELFGDRDHLMQAVLAKLAVAKEISKAVVGDRPAAEVLAQRLQCLDLPEFTLLAAGLLQSVAPARHWVKAASGCVDAPEKINKKASTKGLR